MKNTIKKKITKGFLLFLFTFFSAGVQGQEFPQSFKWQRLPQNNSEWKEDGYSATYIITFPPSPAYSNLQITADINMQIPISSSSAISNNGNTSSFVYNDANIFSFLQSLYSSYGYVWGIGDSGTNYYQVSGGGGSSGVVTSTPPCPNPPVCNAGFRLVSCVCVDKKNDIDRCNQAKKNDLRASSPIIINQNNEIRSQSTIKEFGAEQNLTTFPPSATPTFMNIPVRTDPDPIIPAPTITNQFTTKFTWNATDGYTIGASHGHPKGRAPSFADMVLAYKFLKSSELIAAGQTAIDYFKANFTTTIVTQNEVFMVNVTDWDALGKLSQEFDLNNSAAKEKYQTYSQNYINKNFYGEILTNSMIKEATTYAALKIFGHAISMAKLVNGDSKFIPLKLDAEDNIIEITCP